MRLIPAWSAVLMTLAAGGEERPYWETAPAAPEEAPRWEPRPASEWVVLDGSRPSAASESGSRGAPTEAEWRERQAEQTRRLRQQQDAERAADEALKLARRENPSLPLAEVDADCLVIDDSGAALEEGEEVALMTGRKIKLNGDNRKIVTVRGDEFELLVSEAQISAKLVKRSQNTQPMWKWVDQDDSEYGGWDWLTPLDDSMF